MPDISMCANQKCPLRAECYRYVAIPNPVRQSYMFVLPVEGKCQFQVPIGNLTTVSVEKVDQEWTQEWTAILEGGLK